ncbi:MAG: B12-binding domain-containing radical SAM protein, partial [Candidatus Poribacteria bacterium]|nr:B12-binding domain-containing radical SAM protein [Candidatus Poribacteria bacterium]
MDLRQHYQHLCSEERGAHNNFRKPNRFALVYPSTYALGMSSLGVQVMYATLNSREDTGCERVFVPELDYLRKLAAQKKALFSFETQTALNQFDIIGFSVSFESDYVNIPRTLELANIPPLAEARTEWD